MKAVEIASRECPILSKEERVKKALEIMYKKKVDRILISRDRNKLYGIVTEWDIMYKLSLSRQEKYSPYNIPLSGIATYPVDTITPETELKTAVNMFLIKGYSSLPVVDNDMNIIGLVTKKEVIRFYLPKLREYDTLISEVMEKVRGKVELFHSLIQAETKMKTSGYNTLIVHDKNRFIGIITAANIARLVFSVKKIYPSVKWEYYLSNLLVADATIRDVYTLSPDDRLYKAAEIIAYRTQKLIPILDEDENVIGVISRRHILKYIIDRGLL